MTRHRDSGACLCALTASPVLVGCPSCGACAVVVGDRLVCAACAHARPYRRVWCWDAAAVVPDLWLTTSCAGRTLWALNGVHLDLLQSYVGAALREDPLPSSVRRMTVLAKLPAWLKAAKHRDEVLRGLHRLRSAVPGGARH
ncbi:TFIIB-type zinc ribbon-containing protein [Lentzea sp. CA-135723]|uniref:TFIIB-type zinc ribbon-containing protein n=1 Tax=Lentzea sp. CA-135723 TaxID=3239950 RepID=UPI003D8B82D0